MLLSIYDKAIAAVRGAQAALDADDLGTYAMQVVETQKCILAIHSGLKPDEHDVAFNVARLLNFVLIKIEEKDYAEAARFLELLRSTFAQIYDEAVQLENAGVIPPLETRQFADAVV